MGTLPKGMSIIHEPLLSERTTMHIGGKAIAEVLLTDEAEVDFLPEVLQSLGGKAVCLGQGSNILASDEDLPLVLVRQESRCVPVVQETQDGQHRVVTRAGLRLPGLLNFLSQNGLSGLEGLCGIPGSIGGAVHMNAGSYGVDIAQVLEYADIYTPSGGRQRIVNGEFMFSYRKVVIPALKEDFIVLGAAFLTQKDTVQTVKARMQENYFRKKSTQPVTAWSAGCAFKNPGMGVSAGKLLDEAGFRGFTLGGMGFSELHANFLINHGTGTFKEALELLHMAIDKVVKHSGYTLELEVKIWQ